MSRIRANQITNKTADGATTATNGFNVTGVCTATSFSGDGSALTGLSGVSLSGSTNNTVATVSGADALVGESNLTFDSSTNKFAVTAADSYVNIGSNSKRTEIRNNSSSTYLYSYADSTFHVALAGSGGTIQFDSISKTIAQFKKNAECSLYYDNTKRIETTLTGASVTGDLSVSGSLGVGGTVTYEDVTNVDSVGIVTARNGISVTGGVIEAQAGENKIPALYANLGALPSASTYHGMFAHVHSEGKGYFAHGGNWMELVNKDTNGVLGFTGALKEQVKITAGKLSDNTNIDLENGMVHYFTTQETTTSTPNIRFSGSVSLNNAMAVGETISVTIVTTAAAAGYSAQLTIDGGAVTENWVGGSAPSGGGSSGVDIYTYNIIKTASATFTVIANLTKTS
tara:strand:+ start:19 stop:1215 length:1197 start_codon:yes stop_codon:yes gene_type:complete